MSKRKPTGCISSRAVCLQRTNGRLPFAGIVDNSKLDPMRKSEMTTPTLEKIVLVTGSTDGIGKQTALELGQHGFKVFIHARSTERGQAALEELRQQVP